MALTPEQRRNAQIILRVGKQMGASKKALKAALETGLTESNLRNLSYGDRDSVGVFQQRPSQGWKGLTNVSKAAKEFFAQAIPNAGKYGSAGQLAQSVQRSAYPGRYDQRSGQANALLGAVPKGGGYGKPSAPVAPATTDAKTQIALGLLGMGNLGGYGGSDSLTNSLLAAAQQGKQAQPSYGAPKGSPDVQAFAARANQIDKERLPYKWGGGHGPTPAKPGVPLDCSGAVSRVLGVNPRVSGQFAKWGAPGKGKGLTVYANDKHVLMEINGHFWGTSGTNPGGGAGWIPRSAISEDYLKNFTARHLPGR